MLQLAAIGDIMLEHSLGDSRAYTLLREADLALGNLEIPLSRNGYPADKHLTFRSDPDLATELSKIGLDVVSFANNHSMDYGPLALLDTIDCVEKAGIAVVGAGSDLLAARAYRVIRASDLSIAFLGFSSTLPPGSTASPQGPGVAPLSVETSIFIDGPYEETPGSSPYVFSRVRETDLRPACTAISKAREEADVVVVSVHWGVPPGWSAGFQGVLADYQQPLGRALVDAGAKLVLGHHSHTLQGIEAYRDSLICYSLGNFIFHHMADSSPPLFRKPSPPYRFQTFRPPELRESAVFLFTLGRPKLELEVIPCLFDARGECQLGEEDAAAIVLRRLALLSLELGTTLRIDNGRAYVDPV